MIKISPSILTADFAKLGEEILTIKNADYLHVDVMDGVFVPNISIGIPVVEALRKITDMVLDVHLMISSPRRYVERFARAGADIIVFHIEAETPKNIFASIEAIHALGKKAGLSIKPKTPVKALMPYINEIDLVLVMTVEPGFGGQSFMSDMLPKIEETREILSAHAPNCELEVDGGINDETAKLCVNAGANVLVAGQYIFNQKDRAATIDYLKNLS
jgi:ribulose-phosphate 3-epimerase